MKLNTLSYEEFSGKDREWTLLKVDFGEFNLIVGKNSAGKTRLLNVIVGLAGLLSGKQKLLFESGRFDASFDFHGKNYQYKLDMEEFKIVSEVLIIDGEVVLRRDNTGKGEIKAVQLGLTMVFQTPVTELAAVYRRDTIQHDFLEYLFQWAVSVKHYLFGSEFGKTEIVSAASFLKIGLSDDGSADNEESNQLLYAYQNGLLKFGQDFKDAILDDLESLGYPCIDIVVEDISSMLRQPGGSYLMLAVRERDLTCSTPQLQMSQGMYRALALIVRLNFSTFAKAPFTLVIDDIGEGLDFDRAAGLIKLLLARAGEQQFQIFMTTNDRFVMNGVDLTHWSILKRTGAKVEVINMKSAPKVFEEFEYVGLSNFDFFKNEYFLGNAE